MKTIFIVRHAKSSWDILEVPDEKRPLLEKGKKRTKKVIDYFLERKIRPDYIISSHAVRALETAKIFAHALKYPVENIRIESQVYYANGESILNQLFVIPEHCQSAMIVGHNPSLTDFVNRYLEKPIDNLPTSGVVSIAFDTDKWENVPLSSHKLNFIVFPKELTGKNA